jgi:hypothetical protein
MKKLFVFLVFMAFGTLAEENRVSLPKHYKKDFVAYLSLDRVQNHDQFIKLFANDIAMKGKDSNGKLADGAVLVAEVYSVKKNDDGSVKTTMLNRRVQDKLLLIAVMEKQERFGLKPGSVIDTGHWDFGAYKPNGEIAPKNLDACRGCHTPLKERDYIFSGEHLPERK